MNLKVKRLSPEAQLPKKAHNTDACFDLTAVSERFDILGKYFEYGTGLAAIVPEGYCLELYPRSSISNKDLVLSNSCGIVDANYLGEIRFRFKTLTNVGVRKYNVGDRIGQMKLVKLDDTEIEEVTELPTTERGTSGFGSSGN